MSKRFYMAVGNEDLSFRVCDEQGDAGPEYEALDVLVTYLAEEKQAAYHERFPDSGSVDFGEWMYETVESSYHADRDTETRLGPFTASELVAMAEKYRPRPWKGHPNYEG